MNHFPEPHGKSDPDESAEPPVELDGTEADELSAGTDGRWLITTQGSRHIIDLTGGTYRRLPGVRSSQFPYDEVELPITRIDYWPAVGRSFLLWFDDPSRPDALEHYRLSSTIRRIQRLR